MVKNPNAGGKGSIPNREIKIMYAAQRGQKNKNLKPREVQLPAQDQRAGLNEVLDLDI